MALEVDMKLVDQDAVETYNAIGRNLTALMRVGNVTRTPEIDEIIGNINALTVYALGTRKYRQGGTN